VKSDEVEHDCAAQVAVLVGDVVFSVPAGADHLPVVPEALGLLLEEVDVLAVLGVVAEGGVPRPKDHVAFLAGAVVVKDALVVPVVLVAELASFFAGDHDDEPNLARREDASVRLELSSSVHPRGGRLPGGRHGPARTSDHSREARAARRCHLTACNAPRNGRVTSRAWRKRPAPRSGECAVYVPNVPDSADEPRFLGPQLGYARYPTVDPVECVSEAEQAAQSRAAREAERARARRDWERADGEIQQAVNGSRERTGHVTRGVQPGVRAVLRASEQVGRRLQACALSPGDYLDRYSE